MSVSRRFLVLDQPGQLEDRQVVENPLDGGFALGLGVEQGFDFQDVVLPVDQELQLVGREKLCRLGPDRGLVDGPLEDRIEGFLFGQDSALDIKSLYRLTLILYYCCMTTINPWINFNGNAEEAFTFYKSVFGGEFAKVVRFKDIASDEFLVAEKDENKIMYIALPIGNRTMLIANDVPEVLGQVNEHENRSKILVITESKEEADRLFHGLSAGGEVEGSMGDSPWGSYAGMFRDKYGIEWIIEF